MEMTLGYAKDYSSNLFACMKVKVMENLTIPAVKTQHYVFGLCYQSMQCNVYSTSHSYWSGFATGFQDSPAFCAFYL